MIEFLRHRTYIYKKISPFVSNAPFNNLKVQKRLIPYGPEKKKNARCFIFAIQYLIVQVKQDILRFVN